MQASPQTIRQPANRKVFYKIFPFSALCCVVLCCVVSFILFHFAVRSSQLAIGIAKLEFAFEMRNLGPADAFERDRICAASSWPVRVANANANSNASDWMHRAKLARSRLIELSCYIDKCVFPLTSVRGERQLEPTFDALKVQIKLCNRPFFAL